MTAFQPPRSVLLVGAAGAGLRAAGEFLRDAGGRIFAADADRAAVADWAVRAGAEVVDEGGPAPPVDLVLHTAAADPDHPLLRGGTRTVSYPQWLGELSRRLPVVAVAGTHGKTTTAALLRAALGDVSYLIGGEDRRTGRSGGYRPGTPVIVEACEYRRHFLELSPAAACVLPCEWDHPDSFADAAAVESAFDRFVAGVRGPVADFRRTAPPPLPVEIPNLGRHLQANAAAAAATAVRLGEDPAVVAGRLQSFTGVRRRFEVFDDGPVTWIDDYAHHPTAVGTTLTEARRLAGDRPLVAVFEPHQAGRLAAFGPGFAAALRQADEILIPPVFAAREYGDGAFLRASLCRDIGPRAMPVADLDRLAALLQTRRRTPCVVAVLGAGRIGRFLNERYPHLCRRRPAGGLRPVRGDRAGGRGPGPVHVA